MLFFYFMKGKKGKTNKGDNSDSQENVGGVLCIGGGGHLCTDFAEVDSFPFLCYLVHYLPTSPQGRFSCESGYSTRPGKSGRWLSDYSFIYDPKRNKKTKQTVWVRCCSTSGKKFVGIQFFNHSFFSYQSSSPFILGCITGEKDGHRFSFVVSCVLVFFLTWDNIG